MKYKVGDQVKYYSGDWWFYGTVTAIIENSISPCYRISVDRIVKKQCKFSITQFEFELAPDKEDVGDDQKSKWEKAEIENLKKYFSAQIKEESPKVVIPEPVIIPEPVVELLPEPVAEPIFEQQQTEPQAVPLPEKKQRKKREMKQKPVEEQLEPKEAKTKLKRGDAWQKNYELFVSGDKSNMIQAWISLNRKMYRTGRLSEDKFEKLMETNFSFDSGKRGRKSVK